MVRIHWIAAAPMVAAALLLAGSMAQAQQPAQQKQTQSKQAQPKQALPKQTQPKQAQPKQSQQAEQKKSAAVTPAGDAQPTLLGTYGDWGAYTAAPDGKKVCFALAKPKTSKIEPPARKRDPAYIFISTRPAENVKNEVSLIIGYPFKASSDATAEIGSTKFAMYTQNDGAWIKNVADEARMIEAMRKGSELTVKGTSGRGSTSTDQFSLKGLAQALDRAEQECK